MWWSVEGVTASGSYAGSGWGLGRSSQDTPSSWLLGMRSRSGEGKGSFHECTLPGPHGLFPPWGGVWIKGECMGSPARLCVPGPQKVLHVIHHGGKLTRGPPLLEESV